MHLQSIKQSFNIQYEYQLYFTSGLFNTENPIFAKLIADYKNTDPIKLLFVIDEGVEKHHTHLKTQIIEYCKSNNLHLQHTDTLVVPGGEQSKNSDTSIALTLQAIHENKICRHSFVVVIGGGAVIDMVGYAAAIAHRGVKLIRIPTTVLAQNDAAVGVKNSVNAFDKKNFLGTFAPPFAIINDSDYLATLDQRDWISGIAEAIKVALIKDKEFYNYIAEHAIALKNRDLKSMQYVIYKCAEMHMQHIAQGGDPFETGSSRPLDFGHWAAHKMEFMTDYGLRHGEAVAKGIALDVTYAQLIGLISMTELSHVLHVMRAIGFDLSIPVNSDMEMSLLMNGIEEFREHLGGELTITLIAGLGIKHDVHTIDKVLMKQAVEKLNLQIAIN